MARTRSIKTPRPARLRPKKSLGQHFLVDRNIINRIIEETGFDTSDVILEIGPGKGALTLPLAQDVSQVVAVEKDTRLVSLLKRKLMLAGITNVNVINHDILTWSFNEAKGSSSGKLKIIGNLPYNITSPFLEKIIKNKEIINRVVLMLQTEVAKRLTASPCNKDYGALTLLVQYHARASYLLNVKKDSFHPKPKVDSMVIELDFGRPYAVGPVNEKVFKKIVKGAFSHRRKTLVNSLKNAFPDINSELFYETMKRCGIGYKMRAEDLGMDEFLGLAAEASALALTNDMGE